ncbi:MAG: TraR/DksA family transcriptional regulator [Mailhella sp.]|nr:TraR/DksA family transcriptional regulator [Mailhella sp.]
MDVFDQATELERIAREMAVLQASSASDHQDGPEWIDGVACCRDCGEPIPQARLKAIPGVGRCCKCQQEWERQRNAWR